MPRSPDPQKRQQWRELFAVFETHASSIADFCRSQGVSETSFYYWRQKLRGDAPQTTQTHQPAIAPGFIKVRLSEPRAPQTPQGEPTHVSIRFPGGAQIDVPAIEHELLRAIIRDLATGEDMETLP